MKEKLLEIYKQYKIGIIVGLSIFCVGLVGTLIIGNSSIKEYKNNNYIIKYDNSWKIKTKKDKLIVLEHNKGSKLSIEVIDLQEKYKYSGIDEMLDELLYDIENQNKNFKLLYKKDDSITKNEYDGYRMLYENDDSQAMVTVAKKSDKLIMFTFEAKNTYFDILLDSVQNIIYNFDTVEKKYNLTHELKIKTEEINYEENKNVESMLKKVSKYDIAANNYHVNYSIPSNFKLNSFDSQAGSFIFDGMTDGNMSLYVSLFNKNIYEYMDKDSLLSLYSEFDYYKKNDKEYSNFTEATDKIDGDYIGYVYKCSYYYNNVFSIDEDSKLELKDNIIIVYAIDRNHILVIKLSSSKTPIPKKLIDMIKINFSDNYSSYVDSIVEDGVLKSNLKRFGTTKDIIEEIRINLPEKYKELDKKLNVYTNRNFGTNYNKKLEKYDYEVGYSLTSTYMTLDKQVDLIYDSYSYISSNHKVLSYSDEREINGKKFIIYDGGHADYAGIMFTSKNRTEYYVNIKVLFYELSSGGYLAIKIEGNDKQISDEVLKEVTNFEIVNSK